MAQEIKERDFQRGDEIQLILRNWQRKEGYTRDRIDVELAALLRESPRHFFQTQALVRQLVQARVRDRFGIHYAQVLEPGLIYRIGDLHIPHVALIYKKVLSRNIAYRPQPRHVASWAMQLRLEGHTGHYR